jgi:ADP-ribose pyrophosphatase YjhB (NUDIX family)
MPITSMGIIAFRINPTTLKKEYLMIRRKDSCGYIDFMRGKYIVYNKFYILNMLNQMTIEEKERMKTGNFDLLWNGLWGGSNISEQYKTEEYVSRDKYNQLIKGVTNNNERYTLMDLIIESNKQGQQWEETEWGFPKGRRNPKENDFECALREFSEETGYSKHFLKHFQNILPYEEIFTGSNYKSYKHKYYLMVMDYNISLEMKEFEKQEVSKMEWKTYEDCNKCIRKYNVEKQKIITNIHTLLNSKKYYLHP